MRIITTNIPTTRHSFLSVRFLFLNTGRIINRLSNQGLFEASKTPSFCPGAAPFRVKNPRQPLGCLAEFSLQWTSPGQKFIFLSMVIQALAPCPVSKRIVIRTNTANITISSNLVRSLCLLASSRFSFPQNKHSIVLIANYNRFLFALLNISSPSNDSLILIRWAEFIKYFFIAPALRRYNSLVCTSLRPTQQQSPEPSRAALGSYPPLRRFLYPPAAYISRRK